MPWVRIDENALEHPKISSLSHGAFRLWVQGLACCQKFLTDGLISDVALRRFESYSEKRRSEIVTAGLWHEAEGGVLVHDYLQWNDSRAHVESAKDQARERLKRYRQKQGVQRVANASRNAYAPMGVRVLRVPDLSAGGEDNSDRAREPAAVADPDLADRASRFLQRYAELFEEHRHGARYHGRFSQDFQEAVGLCQTWDDARLEQLVVAFLSTDEPFCRNGAGTIAQFRSRASWCDSKLRKAGL